MSRSRPPSARALKERTLYLANQWPSRRLPGSVRNVRTVASSRWTMPRPRALCAASAAVIFLHRRRNLPQNFALKESPRRRAILPSFKDSKASGAGNGVQSPNVLNASGNTRSVVPQHRQSVQHAAPTLISAITKSPPASAERFAHAVMSILRRKVILAAPVSSATLP